ncbi:hypothetical protein IAQ61_000446 [Plenodomus lingam]|uniref:uncharacterized protein n=1 Tax=Leptosphaeria maculans TaxID=5022 RepID=UPI0033208EB2|nr:hypothetical protein IAQ61_000446 [Plenodomus lingam]
MNKVSGRYPFLKTRDLQAGQGRKQLTWPIFTPPSNLVNKKQRDKHARQSEKRAKTRRHQLDRLDG